MNNNNNSKNNNLNLKALFLMYLIVEANTDWKIVNQINMIIISTTVQIFKSHFKIEKLVISNNKSKKKTPKNLAYLEKAQMLKIQLKLLNLLKVVL